MLDCIIRFTIPTRSMTIAPAAVPDEWEATPDIADSLPLTFSDGSSVPTVRIACASCSRQLGIKHQRGKIFQFSRDVYEARGMAACLHCQGITPFRYRVRKDANEVSLEWQRGNGWHREVFRQRAAWTLVQRIIHFFR